MQGSAIQIIDSSLHQLDEAKADRQIALDAVTLAVLARQLPAIQTARQRFHHAGGIKHLYRLFPGGPIAQGCRLAGLKAPFTSTDRSFGSVS